MNINILLQYLDFSTIHCPYAPRHFCWETSENTWKLKKAVKNTIVIMTMTVTFLWLWKHGHHQFHGTFHGLKITNYQCEECDKWRLVFSKKKLMWISFWWVLVFILYLFFFSEKAILIEDITICTLKGPCEKICGMNRKCTT